MKRLYEIIVVHYAPKDNHYATQEYVVANNDRQVFEYLANGYAYWKDILEDYDGEGSERSKEIYEEIYNEKGDYREVSDLYYGATQYSWKEVKLIGNESDREIFIVDMIENGIAEDITKK